MHLLTIFIFIYIHICGALVNVIEDATNFDTDLRRFLSAYICIEYRNTIRKRDDTMSRPCSVYCGTSRFFFCVCVVARLADCFVFEQ